MFIFSLILYSKRFIYFFFAGDGGGHIQSLIIGALFITIGMISFLMGVIGDLINFNRKLLEAVLERVKRIEADSSVDRKTRTDVAQAAPSIDQKREQAG